jgi:hypothetical protein
MRFPAFEWFVVLTGFPIWERFRSGLETEALDIGMRMRCKSGASTSTRIFVPASVLRSTDASEIFGTVAALVLLYGNQLKCQFWYLDNTRNTQTASKKQRWSSPLPHLLHASENKWLDWNWWTWKGCLQKRRTFYSRKQDILRTLYQFFFTILLIFYSTNFPTERLFHEGSCWFKLH